MPKVVSYEKHILFSQLKHNWDPKVVDLPFGVFWLLAWLVLIDPVSSLVSYQGLVTQLRTVYLLPVDTLASHLPLQQDTVIRMNLIRRQVRLSTTVFPLLSLNRIHFSQSNRFQNELLLSTSWNVVVQNGGWGTKFWKVWSLSRGWNRDLQKFKQ